MNHYQGNWSYITGEKGRNRVRAFRDRRTGRIYLEFRARDGAKKRVATGHHDRELAKRQAEALALQLRSPTQLPQQDVKLAELFENYVREVTPSKGVAKQLHDKATAALVLEILGANRKVASLTHRDAARFVAERRRLGDRRPRRRRSDTVPPARKEVRNRVVGYDLQFLIAVFNWGVRSGLIDRNPFHGFRIPREPSPRRPIVTSEQYAALLQVAPSVDPLCELMLIVAHETGHRIGAIRRLRWNDVELGEADGRIRWRGDHDKMKFEHVTPLSSALVQALTRARKKAAAIGDSWVFPSPTPPKSPGEPRDCVSRHLVRDWWERTQTLASLPLEAGRGWHSLRRKFATELKHVPLKDLSYLGGWKDHQTLLSCYQRADADTMEQALKTRMSLRA
jgi:integrase